MCVLENRLGLWIGSLAATLRRGQLRQYPMPNVEVTGDSSSRRISHGQLRNLHQPRLDGIDQTKVADHPRERAIGRLTDSAQEVGRRRQVHAEVDASQLLDAIQAINPDRGFLEELLGFLFF